MIVYAEREERVCSRGLLEGAIRQTATDLEAALILFGQLEAGAVDEWCPEVDDDSPQVLALRLAAVRLARGIAPPPDLTLPDLVTIRPPEGYAYYALYPSMYAEAARRFAAEHRPEECFVIGIRSIGTSLSAVVAATLGAEASATIRPHGHPFDRKVALGDALRERLRKHRWFAIADEGPGLSGSSFASVAEAIAGLGVPDDRIVLFPSHNADASAFRSNLAKERWGRHPKYVADFDASRCVPASARDIGGGQWRAAVYAGESEWPAVNPHHERRKYLHDSRLWKFSGLGEFGQRRWARASTLHQAGFTPEPLELSNGFLVTSWTEGRPLRPGEINEELLDCMARYLAFRATEFQRDEPVRADALREMVWVNTGLELGEIEDGRVVEVDGRMLPHEWLLTERGYIKADALDHHDDHFFPGCQDVAWDIAGAAVEFEFPVECLAERYLRRLPDSTLLRRLPSYMRAYLAYRIGYSAMASESGDNAERARWQRQLSAYQRALSMKG